MSLQEEVEMSENTRRAYHMCYHLNIINTPEAQQLCSDIFGAMETARQNYHNSVKKLVEQYSTRFDKITTIDVTTREAR